MPNYRDFADSIFSSEIWQNEGRPWIYFALGIVFIAILSYGYSGRHPNKTLENSSIWAMLAVSLTVICAIVFGQQTVDSINQNIAKNNISQKYDTSKLKFLRYDNTERLVTASYTDRNTGRHEAITFSFDYGEKEPFLVKTGASGEYLSNIEKDILRPLPKITFVLYSN